MPSAGISERLWTASFRRATLRPRMPPKLIQAWQPWPSQAPKGGAWGEHGRRERGRRNANARRGYGRGNERPSALFYSHDGRVRHYFIAWRATLQNERFSVPRPSRTATDRAT